MRYTICRTCRRTMPQGVGGYCASCASPKRVRRQRAWTELSREVRSRGRCDLCGLAVPPERLEAHHVVALAVAPWRGLEVSNVVAACRPCHLAAR